MKTWALVAVCLTGWVCSYGAWAEPLRTLTARDLARPHRIVGGDPVKKGQMPWQVSLQKNGRHFCGATLISESLVITAAHCAKAAGSDVTVVVGAWDLNEAARTYKVKDMAINNYDSKTFNRDIALILLGNLVGGASAREQPSGQPVSLETRTEHGAGERCTISGWGRLQSGSALPHILRATDVEIKTDSQCRDMFSNYPYNILDTNLCAGGSTRDACQGDSGGPLVCCSKSTEDVASCRLSGIVSWGVGCATDGLAGVYTEVAHYIDWIKDTTKTKFGEKQTRSLTFFDDEKEREFTQDN